MSKVIIHSGNHSVEIEHEGHGDLTYVVEKAQKLFNETRPVVQQSGFGVGQAEIGGIR